MKVQLEGRLEAFGFEPRVATIEAIARPTSWRVTRALIIAGITIGVAPVVAIAPPHFPWLIAALVTGSVLAGRRLSERYTLRSITSTCPRCGTSASMEPGRLRSEQTVRCGSCGHDSTLTVALEP